MSDKIAGYVSEKVIQKLKEVRFLADVLAVESFDLIDDQGAIMGPAREGLRNSIKTIKESLEEAETLLNSLPDRW